MVGYFQWTSAHNGGFGEYRDSSAPGLPGKALTIVLRWEPFKACLMFMDEQAFIIIHPKLGQMVNGIVLPIKKVFALVDSKISVEIKDEGRKLQGRLVAVDEYLNIHMDETIEFIDNQRGRSLGTVVIRGNNILTIAPVI